MISRSIRLARCAFAGFVLAVTAAVTPATHAQYTEATGIADAMIPDFINRDVVLFVQGLDLDDSQRVILESLFDEYQIEFQAGIDRLRDRFTDMRDELQSGDARDVMLIIYGPFQDWEIEKRQLREGFIQDVRIVVLTEDQLSLWPAFERRFRREKELPDGRYSGERTNLFHILQQMNIDRATRQSIEPQLELYELELDQALQRRREVFRDTQNDMFEAIRDQDSDRAYKITTRHIEERIRVRDVTERHLEIIANTLPDRYGPEFRQRALEDAYPRVFRFGPVERLFEAAKELEDLAPETRLAIIDVQTSYEAELSVVNDNLVKVVRDEEPKIEDHRAKLLAARMKGEKPARRDDKMRDAFRERDEIGDRYVRQLQGLLTPAQFQSLPGAERWLKKQEREKSRLERRNATNKVYPRSNKAGTGTGSSGGRTTGGK